MKEIIIDEQETDIETYFNNEYSSNFIASDKLFKEIDNWLNEMDKLIEDY